MKAIVSLCRKNPYFFLLFLVWLVAGGLLILIFGKETLFLTINQAHTPLLDIAFSGLTYLGDASPFILLLIIFLIRRNFKCFIPGVAVLLLMTSIVQIVKHQYQSLRPTAYFNYSPIVHTVSWVSVHGHLSFPSGHSASAFSLYCFIALLLPNKKWGILCFFVALLTGYSRIYLAQHFFEDVYVGSIIGTLTCLFVYWLFELIKQRQQEIKPTTFVAAADANAPI